MPAPIGYTKMNFQEETYGISPSFDLRPIMMDNEVPISPTKIDGLYYKKNMWDIYYHTNNKKLHFRVD
jgi:hypothetical protein